MFCNVTEADSALLFLIAERKKKIINEQKKITLINSTDKMGTS